MNLSKVDARQVEQTTDSLVCSGAHTIHARIPFLNQYCSHGRDVPSWRETSSVQPGDGHD